MITQHIGDSLTILKTLPDESVDCVVTSPPYYGLRRYSDHTDEVGQEETLRDYLHNLLNIFAEVQRVLKSTGTLFVNIGDSYAGSGKGAAGKQQYVGQSMPSGSRGNDGFKPKDLMQVPARFSIAMQDELHFWLRNDIIWHKPNPLPFSGTDRFTNAYEHIFFFTKSKKYFFNQDAVRTPIKDVSVWRLLRGVSDGHKHIHGVPGQSPQPMLQPRRNVRKAFDASQGGGGSALAGHSGYVGANGQLLVNPKGANRRDVWTFPNTGYRKAHFAVYPEILPEICIKAGCPEGGTVLDPFAGTGTTAVVANRLGMDCILIELNPEYAELAKQRIEEAKNPKSKRRSVLFTTDEQMSIFDYLDELDRRDSMP